MWRHFTGLQTNANTALSSAADGYTDCTATVQSTVTYGLLGPWASGVSYTSL